MKLGSNYFACGFCCGLAVAALTGDRYLTALFEIGIAATQLIFIILRRHVPA